MIFNVTSDSKSLDSIAALIPNFSDSMPRLTNVPQVIEWSPTLNKKTPPMGFAVPTQVNYVAKAVNLYEQGYKFHASAFVVEHYLQNSWLWDRVRVSGGAYGAMSNFDWRTGMFEALSYRDPNLQATIENFDACGTFLKGLSLDQATIAKSIVGTIGSMDQYRLPDAKGESSFMRYLTKDTDDKRQQRRDEVFATTEEHFHQFGEALLALGTKGTAAAVASNDNLREANAQRANQGLEAFSIDSVLSDHHHTDGQNS